MYLLSPSPGTCPLTSVAGRFLAKSEETTELSSKSDGKHSGACSCECKAIVESVLVPLARHYMAMGDAARAFYYLLECAAAYLHVSNSYMVSRPACQHPLCTESSQSPGSGQDNFPVAIGHASVGPWRRNAGLRP